MSNLIDPRHKNKEVDAHALNDFFTSYVDRLHDVLKSVDLKKLGQAFTAIEECLDQGGKVLVAGNGGSAAISDHLCCDWMKGTSLPNSLKNLSVFSLASNSSVLTALANDYGYEECFSKQIEWTAKKGDLCVLISSSGNSPNILKAAQAAKKMGVTVIGMMGFEGGELLKIADIPLFVPVQNYGLAEDSHQILMHVLSQYLAKKRDQKNI